jgi:hypothetical protein
LAAQTANRDDALSGYRWFDETVDIVSAFEYLYTEQAEMSATVEHFERFPSVPNPSGHDDLTPDFTVVFKDGTGLIGEVKSLPLHDNGVDKICHQLLVYDQIDRLPIADQTTVPVSQADLMLIVPVSVITPALVRILDERLADPEHPYSPGRAPIILQEHRTSEKYYFQRLPHPLNGTFREDGREGLGRWLAKDPFPPRVSLFAHIKAARPFVNDPTDPLYLAVLLWSKVFSTLAHKSGVPVVGPYRPLILTAAEIAEHLRAMFDHGIVNDVVRAMAILVNARLAEPAGKKKWRVAFGERRSDQRQDLAEVFIDYVVKPPRSGAIDGLKRAHVKTGVPDPLQSKSVPRPVPGQLFDPDAP